MGNEEEVDWVAMAARSALMGEEPTGSGDVHSTVETNAAKHLAYTTEETVSS